MPNTPEVLFKRDLNIKLFKYFYPEFLSTLRRYSESWEFLEEKFKILGKNIGIYLGEYWTWDKKYRNLKKLCIDSFKFYSGTKKVKIIQHAEKLEIVDNNCIVCWSALEPIPFHYCVVLAGFWEGFLNFIASKYDFPYKSFIGNTTHSKSSGDEICRHELYYTIKYGEI